MLSKRCWIVFSGPCSGGAPAYAGAAVEGGRRNCRSLEHCCGWGPGKKAAMGDYKDRRKFKYWAL